MQIPDAHSPTQKNQMLSLVGDQVSTQSHMIAKCSGLGKYFTSIIFIVRAQGSRSSGWQDAGDPLPFEFIFHLLQDPNKILRRDQIVPAQPAPIHPLRHLWQSLEIRFQQAINDFLIIHEPEFFVADHEQCLLCKKVIASMHHDP